MNLSHQQRSAPTVVPAPVIYQSPQQQMYQQHSVPLRCRIVSNYVRCDEDEFSDGDICGVWVYMWVILTNPLLKAELVGSLIRVLEKVWNLGMRFQGSECHPRADKAGWWDCKDSRCQSVGSAGSIRVQRWMGIHFWRWRWLSFGTCSDLWPAPTSRPPTIRPPNLTKLLRAITGCWLIPTSTKRFGF